MAMDMLRSCYSTNMRFFSDQPTTQTKVLWYFVDDFTPFFPYRTVFNSANWDNDKGIHHPLGEVRGASRPWRSGMPPGLYTGDHFCGTPAMFMQGVPVPIPVIRLNNGQPVCCGGPLPDGFHLGGLLYGGEAEVIDMPAHPGGMVYGGSAVVEGLPPSPVVFSLVVFSTVT